MRKEKERDINDVPVNPFDYVELVVQHVGQQDDPTKTDLGRVLMYRYAGNMLLFKADMKLAVLCRQQDHGVPTCGELNQKISAWANRPGVPI